MNIKSVTKNVEIAIDQSINIYRKVITYRDDRLFTEFLPSGYYYTTLSSVDDCYFDHSMLAKFHLGLLITLLDDFADHPLHFNSLLLAEIYKIPFDRQHINAQSLNDKELSILHLADYLNQQIHNNIQVLPHFDKLYQIFKFDLLRIYQANQFSELMMNYIEIANSHELIQTRPFNMGMVISGMIDLFATSNFDLQELGSARYIFHLGQRFGSICNNVNTFSRESMEGDVTNEIIVKGLERRLITSSDLNHISSEMLYHTLYSIVKEMEQEQSIILNEILQLEIHSFDRGKYVLGLNQLKLLHETMQGII